MTDSIPNISPTDGKSYQDKVPLQTRQQETEHIKKHHDQDLVPIIFEKHPKASQQCKDLETKKFLFDSKSQALAMMIRIQQDVKAEKLWFYVQWNGVDKFVHHEILISLLYRKFKDPDGNLYFYYSDVNLAPGMGRLFNFMVFFIVFIILFYCVMFYLEYNNILDEENQQVRQQQQLIDASGNDRDQGL